MQRREPTLSATIVHDQDEPERGGGRHQPPPPPPRSSRSGGGFLAVVALLLAMASLGGSGYLAWQLQESQAALERSTELIRQLEGRLELTSDEASQSVEEIQEKLRWADSEIRKLWGVSYDRNRTAIAENRSNIEKLTSDLAAIRRESTEVKNLANSLRQQIETSRTAVEQALTDIRGSLGSIDDQRRQLLMLSEQLSRTDAQLREMRNLAQRVSANEEAIAAIDAYRRSINRDLLQIREQISTP